jgi:vitamin B12 transporter
MKGAQSTLYGSDAVAGVINIITKKSGDKKINLEGLLSSGSYRTDKAFISAAGNNDKGQNYFVSYTKIKGDGFSSATDTTGKKGFEKDGFGQDVFRAAFGYKPVDKLSANVYGNYSVNKADIDAGAFADDKDFRFTYRNLQAGVSLKYELKKVSLHFNYNYNRYKRNYRDDSASVGGFAKFQDGKYLGRSHFAEVYANAKLDKNIELLAGIDYRGNATDQSYFSISSFGPFTSLPLSADTANTRQVSTYASLIFDGKNGFNAEAGGRWNHHNVYGDNFTYSFNPFYFKNGFKIFAGLSSGFRAPSLYQLYSEFGNKKLDPETSTNLEGGVQVIKEKINARAVVFTRDIKNVFFFYTNPVTFASMYVNEDRQKDHGLEAELAWKVTGNFNISSNYTFVKGKLSTKDFAGKDTTYDNFYRKPSHTFNIAATYQVISDLLLMAHFKTVSKFYEAQFAAAPVTLKGYYLLDMYIDYKVNEHFKIFADLQNITGQKYADIYGFNSKRFNANAGFHFKF